MRGFRLIAALMAASFATGAQAQPVIVADSGDNGWMLAASLLILFATLPGVGLFYARDRISPALFTASAIVALLFAVVGYTLAFSEGTGLLGGIDNLMLGNIGDVQPELTISGAVYVLFELAVAVFAIAALAGSLAPRVASGWLTAFAALWFLLVYVPVAHWVWSAGWLAGLGTLDYSGGIVIHLCVGISALVAALFLGPDSNVGPEDAAGSSLAGAAMVGAGWLALIGGSGFAATSDTAEAIVNALLAAATALLAGLLFERLRTGKFSGQNAALSAFAGLAAISTGVAYVAPAGAILLGLIGAIGAIGSAALVKALNLGSASRALVAHGGGAIPGAVLFPLFVAPAFGGPGFDDGITIGGQIMTQGIAALAVALWAAIATAIAALMISMVLPMTAKDAAA